jgi:hypothetical protein
MEEALTPFGIVVHGSWLVSRCKRTVVKCVNIGNVEDYAYVGCVAQHEGVTEGKGRDN